MRWLCALVAAGVLLCPAATSAQTRHADAHVHGAGKLLVVIDGAAVSLELAVPAADIVGFEHEPADATEMASVDVALARLAEPLTLFSFAPDAGCTATFSDAHFGDEDEHEAEPHAHDTHADLAASYVLDCPSIARCELTLQTQFFVLFERAETLTVEGLVDSAPVELTLSRDTPSARLR